MTSTSTDTKPSRIRTVLTPILMFIWVVLIAFAFIAAADPPFMKDLSRFGRSGESEVLREYGDHFLQQNDYRMAIGQYQRALKIKPDNVGVLINIAKAYHLSGNSSKALNILQQASKLDSRHGGLIYFNMGEVFQSHGEHEKAVRYFEKSLDREVEQSLVYSMIGTLYYQMEQYERAQEAFERTLELQTDPTTPYMNMLRRNIPLWEEDSEHLSVLERLLREGGDGSLNDYDVETIARIENSDPEVAKTHNYLGAIYTSMGNIDRAIDHFEQSQRIWPGNVDATNYLQVLREMKNRQPAAPPPQFAK